MRTAYTLDACAQQIVYVTGPALAVAVTGWLGPAAALTLAAAATLVGTLAFTTTAPAQTWRATGRRRGDRLGTLRRPPCPPSSPPPASSAAPSTAREKVMRVINQDGRPGRELVLADGLSPADVVLVHREALRVLRSSIDTAHVDELSRVS